MIDLITVPRFCALTGYSDDAVRAKFQAGIWKENEVWLRAPDNRILISILGYEDWARGRTKKGKS
jgi:integrase